MPDTIATELLQLNQRLLDSITQGDWKTYEELCDPAITCVEPEAPGQVVEGLRFHKFYFDLGGVRGRHQTTMTAENVRVMGDVAVLTYVRLVQKLGTDGRPRRPPRAAETRIWQAQGRTLAPRPLPPLAPLLIVACASLLALLPLLQQQRTSSPVSSSCRNPSVAPSSRSRRRRFSARPSAARRSRAESCPCRAPLSRVMSMANGFFAGSILRTPRCSSPPSLAVNVPSLMVSFNSLIVSFGSFTPPDSAAGHHPGSIELVQLLCGILSEKPRH